MNVVWGLRVANTERTAWQWHVGCARMTYSRSDAIGQQHAWQPASFHVAAVQPATAEQGSGAPVLGLDNVGGSDGLRVARTWRALAHEA